MLVKDMVRKPIISGQFYEDSKEMLKEQIKESFMHEKGPGMPAKRDSKKKILGIVSSHAGYSVCGSAMAHSFKQIAESGFPDLYIIFGISHSGFSSCVSLEDWETPLGIVKTDDDFGRKLMKNSGLNNDEIAHSNEHSIEVQLPFLQFVSKDKIDKLRFLAIIVSEDIDIKELAKGIKKTLDETGKQAVFIASSDFTHYGYYYRYVPFVKNVKENIYALDKEAISFIIKRDAEKFLMFCRQKQATICGMNAIAALIEICNKLGAKKAELLQYFTSGDITNDYSTAVGYGSIVIK